MNDISPDAVTTFDELAAYLRQLYRTAGAPSYEALEEQTLQASGNLPGTKLRRVPLRRSPLSTMLAGQTFPRKSFLLSFVEACGVNLESDRRWGEAWDWIDAQDKSVSNIENAGRIRHEVEHLQSKLSRSEQSARSTASRGRTTVTLIPKAEDDLLRLQERTGLSRTDIANRAIILYEFFDAQLSAGHDLIIRDRETGEAHLIRFL